MQTSGKHELTILSPFFFSELIPLPLYSVVYSVFLCFFVWAHDICICIICCAFSRPVLDVIIFIILSPAFVVLFLYLVWRIRLSQQLAADLAPAEVVSNLPIKVFFNSKLKENDPVECVICLEEFEDEAELRVLPCRHEYHVVCIDSWLTKRKKFVSLLYLHCSKFIVACSFHIIENAPLKR